ncbi:hypothetical protein V501_07613 [Pseudogymnoascus sp. VKM F-4519 (FW-2642)]|nr:hypothetical protein V501_07613 [Pseudogymnoascus sp. VKM F-4519 (FW-2642)]
MRDAGVRRVGAEAVLLVVRAAEDVVPQTQDGEDASVTREAEGEGVDGEVARLQTVDEGDPSEVAEGEHESEAVGGDVHGSEHGGFHVEGVEDVEGLEEGDEDDGVGDVAVGLVLVRDEGDVEDDPAEESWAQLAEDFDVDFAEDGEGDARVQFPTDEPVVEHVAGVAAGGELAHVFVAGLDAETADVDEGREGEGDEYVGGDDLGVVVPDVGPDWEVGALRDGTGEEENDGEDGGGESWGGLAMGCCRVYGRSILTVKLILQAPPNSEFSSLDDLSRKEPVQHQAQEIVPQHPAGRLEAHNAIPSRPSSLSLDLVPGQRLGVQHRGDRASVNVVADEIRDVDNDREEERDGECTGPIPNQYATQLESEKSL